MVEVERDDANAGGENDDEWVNGGEIFSDDSSFIGSGETKAALERRAASYNPQDYWDVVKWNIQCLAAQAKQRLPQGTKRKLEETAEASSQSNAKPSENPTIPSLASSKVHASTVLERPYNPYEGEISAKQLSENLSDFLHRLRPSTTKMVDVGPWIWVANPFSPYRPTRGDVARFKQEGSKALADYLTEKLRLETRNPEKTPAAITRMLKSERDCMENHIIELAKECSITSGKWMLFPLPKQVDNVWGTIAKGVVKNELGCSAKVATDDEDPNNRQRLICVYTDDFSDTHDVKRVLTRLRELNLLRDDKGRPLQIYYKCDAYTHLDITNGNEYKLKASMYNSKDLIS